MLNPAPRGEGVCEVCSTFTRSPFSRSIPCDREVPQSADAVLPISYSIHGSQLHRALAGYKRLLGPGARQFQLQLSAVLWRFSDWEATRIAWPRLQVSPTLRLSRPSRRALESGTLSIPFRGWLGEQ